MRSEATKSIRRGFTLIEILITVGIIGILMAVVVPSLKKARERARMTQVQSELEVLAAAVKQLAWDTGLWPGGTARGVTQTKEVWDLTVPDAGLMFADTDFPNWRGAYIDDIGPDPWGSLYFFDPDYRVDGVMRVVVGSFGPNRVGRNVYDSDDIVILVDD